MDRINLEEFLRDREKFCLAKQEVMRLKESFRKLKLESHSATKSSNADKKTEQELKSINSKINYLERVNYQPFISKYFHQFRNYFPKYDYYRNLPSNDPMKEQYEIILNETKLEFFERICEEFNPEKQGSLDKMLVAWINKKLRLKFKVIEKLNDLSLQRRKYTSLESVKEGSKKLENILSELEEENDNRDKYLNILNRIKREIEVDPRFEECRIKDSNKYSCRFLLQNIYVDFFGNDRPNIKRGTFKRFIEREDLKYKRISSFLDRNCFPLIFWIVIEKSNIQNLWKYIERDNRKTLTNCCFKGKVDCQCLAKHLLEFYSDSLGGHSESINNNPKRKREIKDRIQLIANKYGMDDPQSRRKLKEHWEQKCLFLISKLAIAIEMKEF